MDKVIIMICILTFCCCSSSSNNEPSVKNNVEDESNYFSEFGNIEFINLPLNETRKNRLNLSLYPIGDVGLISYKAGPENQIDCNFASGYYVTSVDAGIKLELGTYKGRFKLCYVVQNKATGVWQEANEHSEHVFTIDSDVVHTFDIKGICREKLRYKSDSDIYVEGNCPLEYIHKSLGAIQAQYTCTIEDQLSIFESLIFYTKSFRGEEPLSEVEAQQICNTQNGLFEVLQ